MKQLMKLLESINKRMDKIQNSEVLNRRFQVGVDSGGLVCVRIPNGDFYYDLGFTVEGAKLLASMLVKQAEIAENMILKVKENK